MSNRTLVELNHDFCPNDTLLLEWAKAMQTYMRSGDSDELPYGVTFKYLRHHSEPCPLEATPIRDNNDYYKQIRGGAEALPEAQKEK